MSRLISYAADFVSFVLGKTKNLNKINQIILFGSVARNENRENSDIDLFVDVVNDEKGIDKEITKIKEQFFDSVKYKKYWNLLNIQNSFSIIVDRIDNWKLKDSIYGDAIILYGKYSPQIKNEKNIVLFSWENVKPNSKRVLFNKKIFGYKYRGKHYSGILEIYNGRKLSKGTIMFDVKYINEILKIFRKFKINVKINKGGMWK